MTKNQIDKRIAEANKESFTRELPGELINRFTEAAKSNKPRIRSVTHALEEAIEDWIQKNTPKN